MSSVLIDDRVALRSETPDDYEFLAAVYASTREEELRPVPWTEEQKLGFLRSQFDAQTAHYRNHYRNAEFWVIERDGERAGRLYLHYTPDDLRIVDIALAPAARGHGIGGTLLRRLLDDAASKGCSVSIHVERMNPAMRLYQRLGFQKIDEHGIYDLMSWTSGGEPQR
ncbi:MAG: GNAT family N-acetyltransferase [Acidobacteriota bacterium]